MELTVINYLLHIAPSVVVLLLLLRRSEDHWREVDAELREMLDDCWQSMMDDRAKGA